MYWEEKARYEQNDAGNEWRQALPAWCSIKLHKLLRAIMEGERDSLFVHACSHPMRGGTTALPLSCDLLCMHEWKDEVAMLDAELRKCHDDVPGVVQGGHRCQHGCPPP